jgi:hypothetical protein
MNISKVNLQQKNPDFDTGLDREAGKTITVTAIPKKLSIEVSKPKSVLDHLVDIAKVIVANLPPNPAGVLRDVDAIDAAAKDLAKPETDSDTLPLLIEIETVPNHKYLVQMHTVVTSLTQDSGANEYAETTIVLQWDSNGFDEDFAQTTNSDGKLKTDRVKLRLANLVGSGTDSAEVTIIRRVGTDGAILVAPCTSRVTLSKIQIRITETA